MGEDRDQLDTGSLPAGGRGRRWARYWAIYRILWRNSIVRDMSFKTSFLLWIVVELLWFGLQLCFVVVIYQHTRTIAGWSKWEVVMLMGTSNLIQQLFSAVFLNNMVALSDDIRNGKLDFVLLLPVNTRFLISLREVDLGACVNAGFALAVIGYSGYRLDLSPDLLSILGFGLLCIASLLIHYSLMFILTSVSFWTVRAQGIIWAYYNLFNVARLPDAAFHGYFKLIFTFVLPMLLVANVPVKLVADRLGSPLQMGLLVLMAGICFAASELFWRLSVRYYTSAST